MSESVFTGKWTYRSMLNDPDLHLLPNGNPDFNAVAFGWGTIEIAEEPGQVVRGTIGGEGWSLDLRGTKSYGHPMEIRFQGKGLVGGEEWIYDYVGWLVPLWPNAEPFPQRAAIVGSIVRTIPHSSSGGGTSPAGVVASWYAVRQG
jgi:hypothetical protein